MHSMETINELREEIMQLTKQISEQVTHPSFTCLKSAVEIPEQCVKSVDSYNRDTWYQYWFWYLYC